jgi:hypothetical protein
VEDDLRLFDEYFPSVEDCFSIFDDGVSVEDRLPSSDGLYTWECSFPSDSLISVCDDFLLFEDCFSSVDRCFLTLGDSVSAEDGVSCLDDGLDAWEYTSPSDSLLILVGDDALLVADCFSFVDACFCILGDGVLVVDCLSCLGNFPATFSCSDCLDGVLISLGEVGLASCDDFLVTNECFSSVGRFSAFGEDGGVLLAVVDCDLFDEGSLFSSDIFPATLGCSLSLVV